MSEHFTSLNKAFGGNTAYTSHLATTKMGHGSCRPSATFARGNKFLVVAIEYFAKWIEAKP